MIEMFKKGSEEQISKSFQAKEFDCKCVLEECKITLIDHDMVERLEAMREMTQAPLQITSAFRCSGHQENLRALGRPTAKGRSTHQLGQAVDIRTRHAKSELLEEIARAVGFKSVGVAPTFIHVDMRDDKYRRWFY